MTKFIHIRYDNPDHSISPRGGVTFAYNLSGGVLTIGAAYCHPKDNFNKRVARAKSEGRMRSSNAVVIQEQDIPVNRPLSDFVVETMMK